MPNVGDIAVRYSSTPADRGIYLYGTGGWTKQTAPTTDMISKAWPDICRATLAEADGGFPGGPYGTVTDYVGGGVNFMEVLAVQTAFIQKLFSQQITLLSGGFMQSDGYVPGVSGLYLGADGEAEFGSVLLRGTLDGELDAEAIQSSAAASVATWNSSPSYTGASVWSHFSSVPLNTRFSADSSISTFDGKVVTTLIRQSTRIIITTVGPIYYSLNNDATLYTYTGSISATAPAKTTVQGLFVPMDSFQAIGAEDRPFNYIYGSTGRVALLEGSSSGLTITDVRGINADAADTYDIGATTRFRRVYCKELRPDSIWVGANEIVTSAGVVQNVAINVTNGIFEITMGIPSVTSSAAPTPEDAVYLRFTRDNNRLQYSINGSTWANVNTGL